MILRSQTSEIRVDKQTNRQTDRQTDKQTDNANYYVDNTGLQNLSHGMQL